MSSVVENLADQIRSAFWGESWHGPSVREVLSDVSAEDAAAHPIPGAHSIWEIVLHMTAGYRLVLRRARGEQAPFSMDEGWPTVPAVTVEAWSGSQHTLEHLNQELQDTVRAFQPERLPEPLGSEYPAYTQFSGAPQHDLYHAGQITMLNKALAAARAGA